MKCPYCRTPNAPRFERCASCGRDAAYLQDCIFIGRQFAFFEADAERPIVVDVDGEERAFTAPAIVSRHRHALEFAAAPSGRHAARDFLDGQPARLKRAALPPLDLLSVTTDRKIYEPAGEANVFLVALHAPGGEADVVVNRLGQRVQSMRLRLDEAGLCHARIRGLEEGEYVLEASVTGSVFKARCEFACAPYTLSPLAARLERRSLDGRRLTVEATVTQFDAPFDGWVNASLGADMQRARVEGGRLSVAFDVRRADGELRVELRTEQGNTASFSVPGSARPDRIAISKMDPVVDAATMPFPAAAGCVRGLHYAVGRAMDLPFALEAVVAEEARIVATRDMTRVQVFAFDPHGGAVESREFEAVQRGQILAFGVEAPYRIFTVGAFLEPGVAYETWGAVFHPQAVRSSMGAPERAAPGERIVVRLEADRPAHALLLVYDARLEHESPAQVLTGRIADNLREAADGLDAGRVTEVRRGRSTEFDTAMLQEVMVGGAMPLMALAGDVEAAVETARERFPALAHVELLPLDGSVERSVALGDRVGTWRARAYVFSGVDVVELTRDVVASKDEFVDLDLPAWAAEGDEVAGRVHYRTSTEATLTVTTRAGERTHRVSGSGHIAVPLPGAGRVTASLGADRVARDVPPPGRETVTASRLTVLRRDQRVEADRVMVYPTLAPLLREAVEALIRYPFG